MLVLICPRLQPDFSVGFSVLFCVKEKSSFNQVSQPHSNLHSHICFSTCWRLNKQTNFIRNKAWVKIMDCTLVCGTYLNSTIHSLSLLFVKIATEKSVTATGVFLLNRKSSLAWQNAFQKWFLLFVKTLATNNYKQHESSMHSSVMHKKESSVNFPYAHTL